MRSDSTSSTPTLRIALIGTRGIPAAYGGFETAVEEVGRRLVDRGHRVLVYGRDAGTVGNTYLGIRRVTLPAVRQKALETLSHTALSTLHAVTRARPDAAFVFNAANSPFLPLLRARRIPVALHMDGLEWRRSKWGTRGKAYYRWAEGFGVQAADAIISDAPGIADYYDHQFNVSSELIRYGAPLLDRAPADRIARLGLEPGGYHLVVARFEPENHVREIIEGYAASGAQKQLVVVGSAPYAAEYTAAIDHIAAADDRIRLLGAIYDQELLDALYHHAYTYLHGHSVGGTNPSLLRAMGASTAVVAYDVVFNREVLDGSGWYFEGPADVTRAVDAVEADPAAVMSNAADMRRRAAAAFSWDDVAAAYEDLAIRIARGESIHPIARRARRAQSDWPG